ncbi:MAG: diaminopimelate epimerase [Burkholderiaceae bacterium]|nr:diaminopimelate epimerase [Burkholderiaceae bacterium]
MELKFTKMHGAGNDFIVVDGIAQDVSNITPAQWRALAHRQFGIGADQILLVQPSEMPHVDFKYTIYNQDGSLVENCGNGARCFVKFVVEKQLTDQREVTVHICTGQVMSLKLNPDNTVTVDMGAPRTAPADLPAMVAGLPTQTQGADTIYGVAFAGQTHWLSLVSMGNPHAVQIVADVNSAPVLTEGAFLETHPMFPKRVNVGFMQVNNRHDVHVRVFERGAGETLACGTGICACVVAGIRCGLLDSPVQVHARGGDLSIEWQGGDASVMMTGPAVTVFEGVVTI